jgi:1-aminocyclopropane-1-carboxylate deaminase/D-cysteine desulfhydrase-like pyridoxal-dependent ACC family enzyme
LAAAERRARRSVAAGSSVLFLMTGGTPGIFADKDTLAGCGA